MFILSPFRKVHGLVWASLVVSTPALAVPFVSPKCNLPEIKAPYNGAGVVFDEHCTTAYVLPPVNGVTSVEGISRNANIQFCPSVLKVGNIAASTMRSHETLAKQMEDMIAGYKPLENNLASLRADLAKASAKQELEKDNLDSVKEEKATLLESLRELKENLGLCLDTATEPGACSSLENKVAEADNALKVFLVEKLNPAARSYRTAKSETSRLTNELNDFNTLLNDSLAPILALKDQINNLNNQVFDLYKQYAPLEGLTAQILYTIEWDKLVEGYRNLNPNTNLHWVRVPVKDATLTASVKTVSQQTQSELPALLKSVVPGAKPRGLNISPDVKDLKTENPPTTPSPVNIGDVTIGFGNSVSGQISLSLTGACPYFPEGLDKSVQSLDFKDFSAHLVANSIYTYEMAARRGYTAHYNMSNFINRVEKSKKKGGWFSTKNIHSIVQETHSTDWFDIVFDADAGEFQYTAEEQDQIRKDVKSDLIDRALKSISSLNGLNTAPPPVPEMPGPSGVSAAGKNLMYTCGWNYWCFAGSLALKTADSIFGSKTAVSEFKKVNNTWVKDTVRGVRILERSTALSFAPLKENP